MARKSKKTDIDNAAAQEEKDPSQEIDFNEVEQEPPAEEESEDYESLRQKLLEEYEAQKADEQDEEEPDETETYENEEPENAENHNEELNESEALDEAHSMYQDPEEETPPESENLEIDNVSDNPEHAADNLQEDLHTAYSNAAPDVDQGLSKVAVSSKKSLAMMVGLALVLIFIIYKVLAPASDTTDTTSQVDNTVPITKPVIDSGQAIVVPEIPKIPEAPKLTAPTPPPAPAPPPIVDISIPAPAPIMAPQINTPSATVFQKEDPAETARKKARLTSGIMVGSGNTITKTNVTKDGQSLGILARNNDQIVATNIGDLRRVIAQGKIVDATLETAINTDIPGSVRAITSRDIYSESGKNILIPRGSRLIGNYSSSISFGINRVKISWSRLIRPDGVDINIASPGVDQIGRAGAIGDLDNHIVRSFATAMMTSVIDIAIAKYADKQAPVNNTQTTSFSPTVTTAPQTSGTTQTIPTVNTGGTVTTGTTQTQTQTAYKTAADNIASVGKDILDKTNKMAPTITIDQGAPLKVFVNKDLVFPGTSANLTRIVE